MRNRALGGFKWKRQVPVGPFIVDFICAELGLVVEVDGGQHSADASRDERRTAVLAAQGLTVVRFWNYEVLEDLDAVCATIVAECQRLVLAREAGEEGPATLSGTRSDCAGGEG
ncbi:endonuclease domain-containing protein [Brevundimonas sp.]|uniref:endonuclease domain-containing protein n=1 Tax=Brevundimonas sp. TaxID=1871086 RepID=UPI0025F0FF80|nr:endonuclease domain-containing protein [Brevundimonas sp.]